jgi:hypothetical protein
MTAAYLHRSHRVARNSVHAARSRTKPKQAAGNKHQEGADPRGECSNEAWRDMVSTAAYFRAEARGFEAGSAEDDWYEAEAELREQLARAQEGTEFVPDSGAGPADIERETE